MNPNVSKSDFADESISTTADLSGLVPCRISGHQDDKHNPDYTRTSAPDLRSAQADKILQTERKRRGMPEAASEADQETLATIETDGLPLGTVFAANGHGQTFHGGNGQGVNNVSRTHAEVGAMITAVNEGHSLRGKTVTIYTDRDPCSYCDKTRGIENAARYYGVEHLTIKCPTGTISVY